MNAITAQHSATEQAKSNCCASMGNADGSDVDVRAGLNRVVGTMKLHI